MHLAIHTQGVVGGRQQDALHWLRTASDALIDATDLPSIIALPS